MSAGNAISNISRLVENRLAGINGTEAFPTTDYANLVGTYYYSKILSGTEYPAAKTIRTATGTVSSSGNTVILNAATLFSNYLSGNKIVLTGIRLQNEAATANTVLLKDGEGTSLSRFFFAASATGAIIEKQYPVGRELRLATDVTQSVYWSNTVSTPATVDNTGTYTITLDGGAIGDAIEATFVTDADATRAELNAGLLAAIEASDMVDYVTPVLVSNTITLTSNVYGVDYTLACTTNGTTTNDLTIGSATTTVSSGSLILNLSAATAIGYSIEYFLEP